MSGPALQAAPPRGTRIDPSQVTLLLPTLNEAASIGEVLSAVPREYAPGVLVVDGGSTDGTAELARQRGFTVLRQAGTGLGRAIATGVAHAAGQVIVVMDADGSYDPAELPRVVAKLDEGFDLVIGCRYCAGPPRAAMFSPRRRSTSADDTWFSAFGNRLFTALCRALFGVPSHDVLMGVKGFRPEVFERIRIDATEQDYDVEVLLRAHLAGMRIGELPMTERPRHGGVSKLSSWRHGWLTLRVIARELRHRGNQGHDRPG